MRRAGLVQLMLLVWVAAVQAEEGVIAIDLSHRGPALNPRMYGIFLEEINHGVDGGLYGELIRNRGFEDSRPPEGYTLRNGRWVDAGGARAGVDRFGYDTDEIPFWSTICEGGGAGTMRVETTGGISEASSYCLRMQVDDLAAGRVGVANRGFFGIGVSEGIDYRLSLYARGQGPVTVRLEDERGRAVSGAATFEALGADWKPFSAVLRADRTEPRARLAILAGAPGVTWLDFVSLFPADTWCGRANGLRPDLAELIAGLQPGFVRFPGGCVVEAGTVETAYNWKDTIGPVEERRERWGPWLARRTQGMGVHEYLQFCEDLGAEPLWVGFAGQTCIFRQPELVPMDDMGWVRDGFLDLVDYANGPADSRWGRLRAEAGHPAPFNLRYIEIGNENQGEAFGERYRFIHEALKARHPDYHYLADLSWTSRESLGNADYDIEDRHYYSSARWFASGFRFYDLRDRERPPLYLGEVATTSGDAGPLRGNLRAALAEAVFLMGCERNADTVRMVSYAPLLAHVEGRTELVDAPPPWHAMIYFDNLRAFGTASYHLWKLFATHRPSYTVQTDVTLADAGPRPIAGAVGVGTWGTAAEFKDIRVEQAGETVYASDFSAGADNWQTEGARWAATGGAYRQGQTRNGLSWIGDASWSDYTVSLKARKLEGPEGFLIVFGRQGRDQFWWNVGGWGNTRHAIEYNQTLVGEGVNGRVEAGRWYDVRVELQGRRIRCFLDGAPIHDVNAPLEETFFAEAGRDAAGDLIVKAVNLDEEPFRGRLRTAGAADWADTADVFTLTGSRLSDNNSLDQPQRIVPRSARTIASDDGLAHVFPPHSFTVLRLHERQ